MNNLLQSPTPFWRKLRSEDLPSWEILARAGMQHAPVDAIRLARSLGVRVHVSEDPCWEVVLQADPVDAAIWLWVEASPQRKQISCAHALAHLLLHPLDCVYRDAVISFDAKPSTEEVEANRLGLALLMPRASVQAMLYEQRASLAEMAAYFGVPVVAVAARIETVRGGYDP